MSDSLQLRRDSLTLAPLSLAVSYQCLIALSSQFLCKSFLPTWWVGLIKIMALIELNLNTKATDLKINQRWYKISCMGCFFFSWTKFLKNESWVLLFCNQQEDSQMAVEDTSLLLQALKPSTAAQAVPPASSAPAAPFFPPPVCDTECLMSCPLAGAGFWKIFEINDILIYNCGRLLGT